jgi:hypothetical protein
VNEAEGIAASENTQGEASEQEHPVNHPGKTGHPDVDETGSTGGGSGGDADSEATGAGPSGGAVSGGTGDGDSSATGAGPSGGA